MYHFVYLSFEDKPGGRNYIGKRSSESLNDGYLGSFSDDSFRPDCRIILGFYSTAEAAVQAEIQFQRVFQVVESQEYANRAYQTSTKFSYDRTGESHPHSEATKEKLRKPKSEEVKEKLRGRKRSDETRRKISEAAKKRTPPSEETRRKISEAQKGKPKPKSRETREKISKTLSDPSHPSYGRKHKPETIEKIASANRGKKRSPESILRMREAAKLREMNKRKNAQH
jgi:hypothetical protein